MAAAAKAPLIEVFRSVQGEGRFVGAPMAFVRVATCPIRCAYCDTPNSYTAEREFAVRAQRHELREPNPVTAVRAAELVEALGGGAHEAVSITGGEPLTVPRFVAELGEALRALDKPVHLETAALDPAALRACVDRVDHVSADYKLPETLLERGPGERRDFRSENRACCELAVERGCTVDVKIVLTNAVTSESFGRALADLRALRERVLLVLQPVTPFGAVRESLAPDALDRCLDAAVAAGFDVRVLPQVHKQLGVP